MNPQANYYTKLVLVTVLPMIAIALGWLGIRAHHLYKGIEDAQNLAFWGNVLIFLEFLLSVPPVPWGRRKLLLRQAMRDRLPAPILARAKKPLAA